MAIKCCEEQYAESVKECQSGTTTSGGIEHLTSKGSRSKVFDSRMKTDGLVGQVFPPADAEQPSPHRKIFTLFVFLHPAEFKCFCLRFQCKVTQIPSTLSPVPTKCWLTWRSKPPKEGLSFGGLGPRLSKGGTNV